MPPSLESPGTQQDANPRPAASWPDHWGGRWGAASRAGSRCPPAERGPPRRAVPHRRRRARGTLGEGGWSGAAEPDGLGTPPDRRGSVGRSGRSAGPQWVPAAGQARRTELCGSGSPGPQPRRDDAPGTRHRAGPGRSPPRGKSPAICSWLPNLAPKRVGC